MDELRVGVMLFDSTLTDLELPKCQTLGSSGMDLRSSIPYIIKPREIAIIPTNLVLDIPSGYEGQVRPRSGLAAKYGITVLNTPGTIDCDYKGEVKVILLNHGKQDFTIQYGDRIAQLVFAKVERVKLIEFDDVTDSYRGTGGFGSTGIK